MMSVLIQIISVTTYSLSIAIVVLSRKEKYHLQDFRKPWISDAIMISLNRKHELYRQCKNGIVTFDHYNSFKNNFTTTLHLAKNSYFQRKFTECSNNSRDMWKTLNSLILCKKTSKDVTLDHNGSSPIKKFRRTLSGAEHWASMVILPTNLWYCPWRFIWINLHTLWKLSSGGP